MDVSSAFVKKLKETVELADEAKETLDKYVQASTLAEQLTMQYALSLSIQGKINSMVEQQQANWKVSSSLKKIITMYAKGYVLSSMARFYISCAPDRIIMNILRSSNVKELPTEDDITGNSILQSSIGRALTNVRNQAKDHILSTMSKAQKQVPEDERDLGTVAQALIGDFVDIPCSLALLYRIAIMRGVIDTEPENVVKTAKFWPAVDKEMASRLGLGQEIPKSETAILQEFKDLYDMDAEVYGQPTIQLVNIGNVNYQWKPYLRKINAAASKALPVENWKGTAKPSKRKHFRPSVMQDSDKGNGDDELADEQEGDQQED
ncbi:hypothetical protein F5050DRAFT_1813270 [Lentinula boryana]|uniref:Uncharacterized protein n=1 Tax=Lentinula boryana TaxID=40481 RepID=A0ABQ8PXB7_9AGAR|nr:hypothetical protein F5050DRAFT_1813270 [Lentinula boryana]